MNLTVILHILLDIVSIILGYSLTLRKAFCPETLRGDVQGYNIFRTPPISYLNRHRPYMSTIDKTPPDLFDEIFRLFR